VVPPAPVLLTPVLPILLPFMPAPLVPLFVPAPFRPPPLLPFIPLLPMGPLLIEPVPDPALDGVLLPVPMPLLPVV
jgi:hypothetical protein